MDKVNLFDEMRGMASSPDDETVVVGVKMKAGEKAAFQEAVSRIPGLTMNAVLREFARRFVADAAESGSQSKRGSGRR